MLQVSTTDIVVIWKFKKDRDKIPLFAWERKVIFFSVTHWLCFHELSEGEKRRPEIRLLFAD